MMALNYLSQIQTRAPPAVAPLTKSLASSSSSSSSSSVSSSVSSSSVPAQDTTVIIENSSALKTELKKLVEDAYIKTVALWRWSAGKKNTDTPTLLMDQMNISVSAATTAASAEGPLILNEDLNNIHAGLTSGAFVEKGWSKPHTSASSSSEKEGKQKYDFIVAVVNPNNEVNQYGPLNSKCPAEYASRLNQGGYLIMITYDSTKHADMVAMFNVKTHLQVVDNEVMVREIALSDNSDRDGTTQIYGSTHCSLNRKTVRLQCFRMKYHHSGGV